MKDEIFGPVSDKQKEYAADIQNSGEHLLELINDVLGVSVIEVGKFELSYEDFDLSFLIDNALNIVRPQAEEASLHLTARIDENLPLLSGDRRRVKQALINLLSNAVKFTLPNGSISVDIKYDEANSHVVTIADTGVGMDEQEMAVAMTEFGQVNRAASPPSDGTGLGLPLAIKLVEMHGGTLRLTSEKSVGTTVVINFCLSGA